MTSPLLASRIPFWTRSEASPPACRIGDLSFGARVRNWNVKFHQQFKQRFGYRFDPALAPVHDATLDEWIRIVSGALDR